MAGIPYTPEFYCFKCYKDKERLRCYEEHTLHRMKFQHHIGNDPIHSCLVCHALVKEIIYVKVYFHRMLDNVFKCTGCDSTVENKDTLQFHAECGCTTRRLSR
ncbi:hypothetical protein CEXT_80701 [Caerostris extrusa]|uniref:Uncharacterized protein n=1 Tax=Caerostris extrusa TaxID=172846 RepID=A0AAV4QE45_CAEEX|nr:hypothetical protein CEXT_80701 [Caerostris extrusa]